MQVITGFQFDISFYHLLSPVRHKLKDSNPLRLKLLALLVLY